MRVYLLHFADLARLTRAFDHALQEEQVDSSTIEPEALRLRLLGPSRPLDRLVERIYLEGGLAWCSRHDLAGGYGSRISGLTRAASR